MSDVVLNRRRFLVSSGLFAGGMALSLSPLAAVPGGVAAQPAKVPGEGDELDPWIVIRPDNRVIVRVPCPEIGNGAATQTAMNVAEELQCAWEQVEVEFCDFTREWRQPGTYAVGLQPFFGGHSTDHERMPYTMQLGASARERLKAAAAARWQVAASEVEARGGELRHGDKRLSFGEVAAEAAAIALAQEPALKSPGDWWLIGKATPHKLHLPQVVTGSAVYGIDVKLPGMVHAALKQSPVHGGRVKHFDSAAVMDMPGVRAVVEIDPRKSVGSPVETQSTFGLEDSQLRSGVAVIADHYWQAKNALDALPIEWDDRLGAFWKSNEQIYAKQEEILQRWQGKAITRKGDIYSVEPAQTVEATYRTPYCEHVAMEPLNGTALVSDGRLEVWHSSQDMQQAFWVAVDESGFMPENVRVHQTQVGGGFGRRTMGDDLRVVVAVARQYPGVPVKVIWSREETTRQGLYRTLLGASYRAGLDRKGMPESLEAETCFSGLQLNLGFVDNIYASNGEIENVRLAVSKFPLHIGTGAYRAPCYNSHVFTVETFIDECAAAAGIDAYDYRHKLLGSWDKSWRKCLQVAAEKAGWGEPLPRGQGLGIAISNWPAAGEKNAGTTVCAVARVEVSPAGEVRVRQIDMSFDSGRVANRDAVSAQLEGGIVFAMNMTLNEELTIRDGAIVEGNYHEYPVLRMADMPQINIHFDALSGHERFAIIGEAPVGPVGPAIGNAIFQATGKRLRSMPFRKHDLSWG
ncbi:xanthine dehydrogenase family protein molybdopterin-binding subunit [Mangrovimicrobium sediminis]|uniref:Xanthine dehydrogenase family protein molybdopterin-binding subunit n=1 Tax=Mangrovimicrobium sediminis TaxID=2562682 RepID=A0A4Z0M1H8_9GAMM|nr:molybdopterin cofactor-binding domain-containing protein [Haliea sp. SAOS-164]TGD73287.1 xanthine dehydrogenase family protein molybdopterin-binding subunit [Haliea sp. SAOS-164]